MTAQACETPAEAVRDADIIVSSVTLSFDLEPFVDARDLKPGAFATITDVAGPWKPAGMAAFDSIIIDSVAQEQASAKKMVDPTLVAGDLLGLVTGEARATFDAEKRSAFIFRGLAIGDFAVACLAHERALATGRGNVVPMVTGPDPAARYPLQGERSMVFLKNVVTNPQIEVGDYTYYHDADDPTGFERNVHYLFPFIGDRLVIGRFCAIAHGATFLMNGGNHRTDGIATYPFGIFGQGWEAAMPEAGPTRATSSSATMSGSATGRR